MSFARVVLLYLGECVVLTVPAYVIGALLFEHVILKKVSKYYDYMSNSYSSYVYMVLFAIYFILSLKIPDLRTFLALVGTSLSAFILSLKAPVPSINVDILLA